MPKKTVLAIDDDVTFRKHIAELLESAGYTVMSAANGREAVALIEAHKSAIDLMIVDLCLPDTNGLEIIADMARKQAPIKIVAATGVYEEMYLEIAKTIGADDAIRKPGTDRGVAALLLDVVRRLLNEPAPASEPGYGLIVLADDDSTVRRYVRSVLHSAGYQVLEADDGLAALALIEKIGGALDLLVTDCQMPNMKGPELVRAMRAKYPSVPVVYMSGFTSGFEGERLDDPAAACTFLSKPFLRMQLIEAVTRMMPKSSRAGGG